MDIQYLRQHPLAHWRQLPPNSALGKMVVTKATSHYTNRSAWTNGFEQCWICCSLMNDATRNQMFLRGCRTNIAWKKSSRCIFWRGFKCVSKGAVYNYQTVSCNKSPSKAGTKRRLRRRKEKQIEVTKLWHIFRQHAHCVRERVCVCVWVSTPNSKKKTSLRMQTKKTARFVWLAVEWQQDTTNYSRSCPEGEPARVQQHANKPTHTAMYSSMNTIAQARTPR